MVPESNAGPLDHLTDLTGKATAVVTLKARDNFNSEYRYDVSVKNLSADTFIGDSLFIVLDKVTNIGGEDRENLNSDTILSRMEVLGQDGETQDGKPYFQIPAGSTTDLTPSQPESSGQRTPPQQGLYDRLHALVQSVRDQATAARRQDHGETRAARNKQHKFRRQVDSVVDQKRCGDGRRMAQGQSTMTDPTCKACQGSWPKEDHFIADLGLSKAYLDEDQFFPGWTVVVFNRHATELFHLAPTERIQLMEEVNLRRQDSWPGQ